MLKKLPVKKEYLLFLSVVLLLVICYQLALKKTIEALVVHKQLQVQLNTTTDLSVQPNYLLRKNNNLDNLIQQFRSDTNLLRSNFINKIATVAENEKVKMSQVPVHDNLLDNDKILIQKLDFEGSFFDLTRFLNRLTLTKDVGVIKSVVYKLPKASNGTTKQKTVELEIYFAILK